MLGPNRNLNALSGNAFQYVLCDYRVNVILNELLNPTALDSL